MTMVGSMLALVLAAAVPAVARAASPGACDVPTTGGAETPRPVLLCPVDDALQGSTQPTLYWTATAGTFSYAVLIDGALVKSGLSSTSWRVETPLTQGRHTWLVIAYQVSGPAGSDTEAFVIDTVVDVAPKITGPVGGARFTHALPTVTWNAAVDAAGGSGVARYDLHVDGTVAGSALAGAAAMTPTSPLTNGSHALVMVAYDELGNSAASAAVTITVDVPAPVTPVTTAPSTPTTTEAAPTVSTPAVTNPVDVCANLVGDQASIPEGYTASGTQCAAIPVKVTEPVAPPKVRFTGNATANRLIGNALANVITGMGGNDMLVGGAGNDKLSGGAGKDTVRGGVGNDRIVGGAGKDRLFGEAGNDTIDGADRAPGDVIDGGPGIDTCRYDRGDIVKRCEKLVLRK